MLVRAIGSIKHITVCGWGRTSIRLGLVKWTSALETELLCSPPELRYLFNCDVEHFQTIAKSQSWEKSGGQMCSHLFWWHLLQSVFLFQYSSILNITLLDVIQDHFLGGIIDTRTFCKRCSFIVHFLGIFL